MGENDFQDRLMPGERIAWTGAPATGLLLTSRDIFLIPFSLLWGGFAVFWEWNVLRTSQEMPIFPLFGIPFVVIGLYFIAGRFFVDAWVRSQTRYAVTNQRVLILRLGPVFAKFTSLAINRLPELALDERADGRGTIRFQPQQSIWNNRNMSGWTPSLDPTPQFLSIADARSVFDRIQRASQAG